MPLKVPESTKRTESFSSKAKGFHIIWVHKESWELQLESQRFPQNLRAQRELRASPRKPKVSTLPESTKRAESFSKAECFHITWVHKASWEPLLERQRFTHYLSAQREMRASPWKPKVSTLPESTKRAESLSSKTKGFNIDHIWEVLNLGCMVLQCCKKFQAYGNVGFFNLPKGSFEPSYVIKNLATL